MKAAIVGLVRGYENVESYYKLIRRNQFIHKNFNKSYNYPLIIFHEGNIQPIHQTVISEITPNVEFVDVSQNAFIMPKGVEESWQDQIPYKHMCRFYAMQIYDYVDEYDYIWRLDDDSFIESNIKFDVFSSNF